jgi:general secretion pathway protein D
MLLGTQTGTFWRALNPTLIFVAPDNPEKRKSMPRKANKFPLPASVAPDEMTELLRVLRDITGATHAELDTRSRTITMRDTPERLAVAGQLIHEVEKARGEVLLDIELLEVDRTTMQKLGITPPTSASLIYLTPTWCGRWRVPRTWRIYLPTRSKYSRGKDSPASRRLWWLAADCRRFY